VQLKRGCAGSKCDGFVCKILHNPHLQPTHQYIATYRYFEEKYNADAVIHVGTPGNLEFSPG
jgi:cobaltochelatase CobN